MPDVHTLRVFAAVAEKLSLTRAGEAMALSQSAVSHQLAKLEAELQVRLFDRHGRQVSLTPAGQTLLRHGADILQRVDGLAAAMRTAVDPNHGTLRVGATAAACQYLLPDPIREMRECFPKYAIRIVPGDSPAVVEALGSGLIDLGILISDVSTRKLPQQHLFRDQLGLVLHPSHRLAAAKRIAPTDLTGEPWVFYSRTSVTAHLIDRHFARLRIEPGPTIELGSIEAIKELVKVGLGLSVLARWAVTQELAEGSLLWRPLPGAALHRDWVIARRNDTPPPLAEETFVELCQDAARSLDDRRAG